MKFFTKKPALLAPAAERTKEERDFVRRLDIFLMTFGCISQVIKYLDQQNINASNKTLPQQTYLPGSQILTRPQECIRLRHARRPLPPRQRTQLLHNSLQRSLLHNAHTLPNHHDIRPPLLLAPRPRNRLGNSHRTHGNGYHRKTSLHHSRLPWSFRK